MLWGNGLKPLYSSILLGRNGYRFFVATWITLVLNLPFFNAIPSNYVLGIGVFLWLLNSLVLFVLSPGILFRPAIVLVVLASSSACYFMSKYGVVIDRSMIQNVVATDSHEASELLSLSLFSSIVLGSLPLLLLLWVRKPSNRRIDNDCLNKKATSENSHDMLFSTILDITSIAITTDVSLSPGIRECQTIL